MSSYNSGYQHEQKNPFAPIPAGDEPNYTYPERYAYYQHNSSFPRLETPPPSSFGSYSSIYPPPPSVHDERLGLIRGYHHQLYDQNTFQTKENCCSCSTNTKPNPFICRDCNWGVAIGCILLIIGVLSILMGFMVPESALQEIDEDTGRRTLDENLSYFIDVFVIFGLSILSVGGLLISISLLLPLWRRSKGFDDNTGRYYHASEWYVKEHEKMPHTKCANADKYLCYNEQEEIPGDLSLRKIQPEQVTNEPVEMLKSS